uniref:SWIM-type domain-containing protein n=1 Tax=Lactuca sativa TaxID=4236 RepID=A0A9R1XEN7_LACSA|nr:hypothetical protein LSAT_V11C400214720 [Lactuca sativa]
MEEFGEDIKSWNGVPSGVNEYEVRNGFQNYGVNLKKKLCACRLWELAGIPCVHAQVAILYTNQDPINFISNWFSKNNYKATYDQNIHPVNGSILWEETSYTKPLSPIERRMLGRPSVKRRRHSQVSRKGRTVQCKNCLQRGHNKTSCKNPIVVPEPQPKKKIGRPRLEPDLLNWSGTKTGSRGGGRSGGRVGGGRSRGVVGDLVEEAIEVVAWDLVKESKHGEGTSEFPKCEPELVDIPNIESENDASPNFHNHISLTIDNLRKSLYTIEEIMDCLGLSLGLSEAEVQQIEDVDVSMSQDVGIAS